MPTRTSLAPAALSSQETLIAEPAAMAAHSQACRPGAQESGTAQSGTAHRALPAGSASADSAPVGSAPSSPGLVQQLPWVLAAIGAGFAVTGSSRINAALGAHIGQPIVGAATVFTVGLATLSILALFSPAMRTGLATIRAAWTGRGFAARAGVRRLKWFEVFGGAIGSIFVMSQSTTVPVLGLALFTVSVVCGQSIGSLITDVSGVGPAGKIPVTATRLISPAVAIAAVGLSVSTALTIPGGVALALFPLLGGVGLAIQHGINGNTKVVASAATPKALAATLASTWVSFAGGVAFLVLAAGVAVAINGGISGSFPGQLWMYSGALLGITFVSTSAFVVGRLGVLQTVLFTVAGQMVAALLLDLSIGYRPGLLTFIGAGLTLLAAMTPLLMASIAKGTASKHAGAGKKAGGAGSQQASAISSAQASDTGNCPCHNSQDHRQPTTAGQ